MPELTNVTNDKDLSCGGVYPLGYKQGCNYGVFWVFTPEIKFLESRRKSRKKTVTSVLDLFNRYETAFAVTRSFKYYMYVYIGVAMIFLGIFSGGYTFFLTKI